MKKVIVIIAAALMLASMSANAQSLSTILQKAAGAATTAANNATGSTKAGSIINKVGDLIYSYTGASNKVSLPGTWKYQSVALALTGDSDIANVTGTAVATTAEQKINDTLAKFGFAAGSVTFVFNEDLSFTCNVGNIPLNGTWKTLNDGSTVQLQFGKAMKYLSMTGELKGNLTGCEMMFDGGKFLSFMKSAMSMVGSASSSMSALTGITNNYKGMKIGFRLSK